MLVPEDNQRCYLRPHQVTSADRLLSVLSSNPCAIDVSQTGTGKTYVACAVAKKLKVPTLAVVPKIAISSWQNVSKDVGEEIVGAWLRVIEGCDFVQ